MQLGMIGLGRMGANMVRRLEKNGHKCVVYDRSADSVTTARGRRCNGGGLARRFRQETAKAPRHLAYGSGSGCGRHAARAH